jgi:23S rRNA (uracil1939-C5)-methyltransferase
VLVVDKSPHEPVTPQGEYSGSLLARVRRIRGAEDAVPVQRVDAGASGLVVFVRRAKHAAKWQRALSDNGARVIYVAAVRGITPVKGRCQRTRYRRVSKASGHSVLRIVAEVFDAQRAPPIGRHLASIGHPILGDERYGHAPTNRYFAEKCGLDRPFVHCARIELAHPDSGTPLVVEARLPGDLTAVLVRMGGEDAVRSAGPPLKREPRRPRPDA